MPPPLLRTDGDRDEPPPFLGSWSRVYLGVALYLVAIIALFHLFTRLLNR
jgi:hypothetical protein